MIGENRYAKINEEVMKLDTQDFQQLLADDFAGICRDNFRRPDAFISIVDGSFLVEVIDKEKAVENLEAIIDGCQSFIEEMKK